MTALHDEEDNPPLAEPSSIPPEPIEAFREHLPAISTIPTPDPIVAALMPKLDDILKEIGGVKADLADIKKIVSHLDAEVVELRASRITTDLTLGAIDRGVSGALDAVMRLDTTVHTLKKVQTDTADRVLELGQNLFKLSESVVDRHDHVMARVVAIEDWKKIHDGENDGSLVAALARESGE